MDPTWKIDTGIKYETLYFVWRSVESWLDWKTHLACKILKHSHDIGHTQNVLMENFFFLLFHRGCQLTRVIKYTCAIALGSFVLLLHILKSSGTVYDDVHGLLVGNLWTIVFWYKMHEIDYLWYIFGYFDSQSDENK